MRVDPDQFTQTRKKEQQRTPGDGATDNSPLWETHMRTRGQLRHGYDMRSGTAGSVIAADHQSVQMGLRVDK